MILNQIKLYVANKTKLVDMKDIIKNAVKDMNVQLINLEGLENKDFVF